MGKILDLTGKRFGHLVALRKTDAKTKKGVIWECICDCGKTHYVFASKLTSGHTSSCGCYAHIAVGDAHRKHGKRNTRLYNIWIKIKGRCNNPKNEAYENYGGRGIKIFHDWEIDFQSFYDWAIKNGYQDNLSIDRIDNNKGYSPDNCRWATAKIQSRNKRNNRYITAGGETHILEDWAKITGISKKTIHQRLKRGWSEEKSVMQGVTL